MTESPPLARPLARHLVSHDEWRGMVERHGGSVYIMPDGVHEARFASSWQKAEFVHEFLTLVRQRDHRHDEPAPAPALAPGRPQWEG